MMKNEKPVIGISIGDPAGIGPEICVKVLVKKTVREKMIPVVYADRIVLETALGITGAKLRLHPVNEPGDALDEPGTVNFIGTGSITHLGDYAIGETGKKSGGAAFAYVVRAIDDAIAKKIAAVVTCPISKEAINLAGHQFAGHTEIFAHYTKTREYGMLLSANNGGAGDNARSLNVIHVTTHVSLRRACELVTAELVYKTICLADRALDLMGSKTKRIAVAGLNPHSSENGLFGNEEEQSIIPAVNKAKAEGMDVTGPLPPDTVFVKTLGGRFDIAVAMYHDQGHIPLKLCGFTMAGSGGNLSAVRGVNATIGLPIIRTSVDHGTAFDIAGKNLANEESLLDAIDMAITFVRNFHENPPNSYS